MNGEVTIFKGYSWDGCTPKFKLFGKTIGTPDGKIDEATGLPKTYYASLVHDCLYQYSQWLPYYIKRRTIDNLFYKMLKKSGFSAARVYWVSVSVLGWLFWD